MPLLTISHNTFVSDKTKRRAFSSGISGTVVNQIKSQEARLLPNATATIAFTSRISVVIKDPLNMTLTYGSNAPVVFTQIKGFFYLPGPGTLVLTNSIANPRAIDGGVDFTAVYD